MMTITALIAELTKIHQQHGNLTVQDTDAHPIISVTVDEEAQVAYIESEF